MGEEQTQGTQLPRRRFWFILVASACVVGGVVMYFTFGRGPNGPGGIAGCGLIRNAFRVYAVGHNGTYHILTAADGAHLAVLGVNPKELNGRFLKAPDYEVNSTSSTYTIKATLPNYTPTQTYTIDQDGKEGGTYTTGE